LFRAGFIVRTPRGRVATAAGWRHLGLVPPVGSLGALAAATLFEEIDPAADDAEGGALPIA
jgi:Holliday junction DNA helicase RuvB